MDRAMKQHRSAPLPPIAEPFRKASPFQLAQTIAALALGVAATLSLIAIFAAALCGPSHRPACTRGSVANQFTDCTPRIAPWQ
jgi:hypothetical protein